MDGRFLRRLTEDINPIIFNGLFKLYKVNYELPSAPIHYAVAGRGRWPVDRSMRCAFGGDGGERGRRRLLVASDKTSTDHMVSMVSKKDCALWRVIKGRAVCKPRERRQGPLQGRLRRSAAPELSGGRRLLCAALADHGRCAGDKLGRRDVQERTHRGGNGRSVAGRRSCRRGPTGGRCRRPRGPAVTPAAAKTGRRKLTPQRSRRLHRVRRRLLLEQEGFEIVERLEAHGVACSTVAEPMCGSRKAFGAP